MLDKEKAYSILGLDANASDEELEKRYALLVRKQRHVAEDSANASPGEPTMAEINVAYNFIRNAAREEIIRKSEPKNKTVGRIAHIYEYYRWHIIGSIAAIALIVYMASGIIDNRNEEKRIARADLKVTLFWEYDTQNPQPLKDAMLAGIPEWKDIYLTEQYAPLNPKDQYDISMQQKAMITMTAEKADLYIMDKNNFELYGRQGIFLDLTDQPGLANVAEDERHTLDVEDEGTVWAGIEVSDSPALQSLHLPEGEYIAGIRINAVKKENAAKALEWLAGQ